MVATLHFQPGRVLRRPFAAIDPLARAHAEIARLQTQLNQARQALELREALLHDIDHRTKNTLQMTASMLRLQARRAVDTETNAALGAASNRLLAVAAAHVSLNRNDGENQVALDECLREVCGALASQDPDAPSVRVTAETVACPPELAIPLSLFASEAVMNALKHGYPDGRGGAIEVVLKRVDDGRLRLAVSDDGVGLADRMVPGMGVQLMETFARQVQGDLKVTSQPGAGCTVTLLVEAQDAL